MRSGYRGRPPERTSTASGDRGGWLASPLVKRVHVEPGDKCQRCTRDASKIPDENSTAERHFRHYVLCQDCEELYRLRRHRRGLALALAISLFFVVAFGFPECLRNGRPDDALNAPYVVRMSSR